MLADVVSPRRTALHRAAFGPSDEPPLPDPLPEPELEPELEPLPLPEPELPELPELLELLLDELLNEELLLLLLAGAELDELLELLELDCEVLESLWTQIPSATYRFVPGTWSATVRAGVSTRSRLTIGSSVRSWRIRASPTCSNSVEQKPH